MEKNRNPIEIKSGLNWFFGAMGFGLFLFASLAILGGAEFNKIWMMWLFAFIGIWLFKTDEFWLSNDAYIDRNIFWRKNTYHFEDLKWIEFRFKNIVFLWFGEEKKEINMSGSSGKKIRAALEEIGAEYIPYFGYEFAERTKLSRGQLSGCLDCHQIFPPNEFRYWDKLPKSFWLGRKTDQYFTQCPSCKSKWVYTSHNPSCPVTSEALQEMDKAFHMNKDTKIREIIGETLGFQTSFKYFG